MSDQSREKKLKKYIDRMPSLSTTVTKVTEVCNNPNSSPNDLNKVISLDPVLTAKVLKLVNSAFYSLPGQIVSLTKAIIMLGMNTVKNLALSTAIMGVMSQKNVKGLPLNPDDFWLHSLSVAVYSKTLASIKGKERVICELCFVAGLLHDLGKLLLSKCFPNEYLAVLKMAGEEDLSLVDVERKLMGIDHGMAGKMIAEKWKLDRSVMDVLAYHHDLGKVNKDFSDIVRLVAIADIYSMERGFAGNKWYDRSLLEELLEKTDLSEEKLDEAKEIVQEQIEKANIFLEVSK